MRTLFTVLVLAGVASAQTSVDVKVRTQAPPPAVSKTREVIEWVPVRRTVCEPGQPCREVVTFVEKRVLVPVVVEAPPPVVLSVPRAVRAVPAESSELRVQYGPFGRVRSYEARGVAASYPTQFRHQKRPSVFGAIFGY